MDIIIKQVDTSKPKNRQLLRKLHTACFRDSTEHPDYRTGFWWIASERLSGAPAGFCGMSLYNSDREGYLARSGVLPKYRGLGLQRRMIRIRLSKAKRLKLKRVTTYTAQKWLFSLNNLIKEGFELYWPEYVLEGDWFYLEKPLK